MPGNDVTIKANWIYAGGGSGGTGSGGDSTLYYTITASAGVGGSITPAGSVSVASGNSKTYTITPNRGYAVAKVLIDGKSVGSVTSYTFAAVTGNHTISVTFLRGSHTNPQTGVEDLPGNEDSTCGISDYSDGTVRLENHTPCARSRQCS